MNSNLKIKNKKMNIAIILAAGSGRRFGSSTPKQFMKIKNKRIIDYTIEAFERSEDIDKIIIVVSKEWVNEISKENSNYKIISGGKSRRESSYKGLMECPSNTKKVLIHDGARPFVSQEIIKSCLDTLNHYKAVVTSIPFNDTIVRSANQTVISIENRNDFFCNQTPQGFEYKTIIKAHEVCDKKVTDDISLLDLNKIKCKIIEGSPKNIKITNPSDIYLAENILKSIK